MRSGSAMQSTPQECSFLAPYIFEEQNMQKKNIFTNVIFLSIFFQKIPTSKYSQPYNGCVLCTGDLSIIILLSMPLNHPDFLLSTKNNLYAVTMPNKTKRTTLGLLCILNRIRIVGVRFPCRQFSRAVHLNRTYVRTIRQVHNCTTILLRMMYIGTNL